MKQTLVVLVGIALIVLSVSSCINDEEVVIKQQNESQGNQTQSLSVNSERDSLRIGTITKEGNVVFTIDINELENKFLDEAGEFFEEIESIEIEETYLTIIGKDIRDYSLLAFQAELTKDGSDLYFPDVESASNTTFATNTCSGVNCTGCSFTRTKGNKGKITGCNCSGGAGDGNQASYCNHSTSQPDTIDQAKKIADILTSIIKLIAQIF